MHKLNMEQIAGVCHEAIRSYNTFIGDPNDAPWIDAPEKLRLARIKGVEDVLENGSSPEVLHEGWRAEKIRQGWTYGLKKDRKARVHHCLLAWDELPKHQQAKAHLFTAIARSLVFA